MFYTQLFSRYLSVFLRKRHFYLWRLAVSRNCLLGKRQFFSKIDGHGGPLKTISPQIFFDILSNGCIVNPQKAFLLHLKI